MTDKNNIQRFNGANCNFNIQPLIDSINKKNCIMCFQVDGINKEAKYNTHMNSGLPSHQAFLCQECVDWTIKYYNLKSS